MEKYVSPTNGVSVPEPLYLAGFQFSESSMRYYAYEYRERSPYKLYHCTVSAEKQP